MDSFQWGDHFLTGLLDVDEQHHRLVDIINQFGSHLTENDLVLADIENVFNELLAYTKYHFQEEEEMMTEIGIDPRHFELQTTEHNSFLKEITEMHDAISVENPASIQNLLDFLIHWLAYHILGTDQNMARQVKSIQLGVTPSVAYEEEKRNTDEATEPLLSALTGLFQQVSERNKALVELNESLEEKVAERTGELYKLNIYLEKLALTDALTGLSNRRDGMQKLAVLWEESLQKSLPLACLMIDADHFKQVNDTYGHDAGDSVLCELAKTLQHQVRTDDIVCRLGGDEFLIICPNTDKNGAMTIANKVHKKVSELQVPTGHSVWKGSISVGVAVLSSNINKIDDLIKVADDGVYLAKRDGKNCVRSAV